MMDVRVFSATFFRSRWKPFFCFCLLALAIVSPTEAQVSGAPSARRDRQILGFFFSSSPHQAVFPVTARGGDVELVIVDLETGVPKRLSSSGAKLLSPSFSSDGKRLLLVRLRNDTAEYELLSCTVAEYVCRRWLSTKDSIVSPVEVSADKIVYVSSPRKQIAGVRSQYLQHDLWMLEKDKSPQQLTDVQFGEMNWLSVTSGSIYFSAIGPRRGKEIIPKFAPLSSVDSDIFKLPFVSGDVRIEFPEKPLTPLFLSRGRSTAASVAFDGSVAALLRAENRRGGYRYDLVVVNLGTKRENLIESTGIGFSRPAIVDQEIITREIFDDRYVISRLRPGDSFAKPIAELTDAAIAAANFIEIRVEQGR